MSDLASYQLQNALELSQSRFNALAEVAGKEMARWVKPSVVVPLTIGVSVLGAAIEARFAEGGKGAIANAIVAAGAYAVGFMAGDNADLRWASYAIAMGLGSAAASQATYDKVTHRLTETVAPVAMA